MISMGFTFHFILSQCAIWCRSVLIEINISHVISVLDILNRNSIRNVENELLSYLDCFFIIVMNNHLINIFLGRVYLLKVNNKDTRTTSVTYFTPYSSVSIGNFEHVIAGWAYLLKQKFIEKFHHFPKKR